MTILDGAVVLIGIPTYLDADALARGVAATQPLSDDPESFRSEYRCAHVPMYNTW
jgi:hypothetical protein